ncbi:MAG: hypothetical protein Q8P03_02120 [bacterium]|nr:hypothetical protein [bacterium]
MLGTFVVLQGDVIAEKAASSIRHRFPVKELKPGEAAGPNDIALIGWTRKNRNGLKNGFSSGHVRIPPEKRILRDELPPGVKICERIVFVQDNPMRDPNTFELSILTMLVSLGLPLTPQPAAQGKVAAREPVFA